MFNFLTVKKETLSEEEIKLINEINKYYKSFEVTERTTKVINASYKEKEFLEQSKAIAMSL